MLRHMLPNAERAVHEAERAVEAAGSAFEAASADWLLAGADQDLAWQRKRQHDLDNHGIVLMDKGEPPYELDDHERNWNEDLQWIEWATASRGAYVDELVDAHTNAPSDDVPPEPNVAAARVVAPASGSAVVAPASGSAAASSGYLPDAPDAAGDVPPWHYWCYGAVVARAIEAAADADAIAATPPPAAQIPWTIPPPPPPLERSRPGDARIRASSAPAAPASTIPLPPSRQTPRFILRGPHEATPELDVDWTLSEDLAEELRLREVRHEMIKTQLQAGIPVCYRSSGWSLWPRVFPNDQTTYEPVNGAWMVWVDDIVFCQVQPGNRFYAHLVKSIEWYEDDWAFTISNIHGFENGWCRIQHIYGRLTECHR